MTGTAEEILVELLGELEHLCRLDQLADHGTVMPRSGPPLRGRVLETAYRARTRLEKVRLGVVAA